MPRHQNSLNSLGQEGDEEDWEKEMRGMHNQDEVGDVVTFMFCSNSL
jgi:hypothetical protein